MDEIPSMYKYPPPPPTTSYHGKRQETVKHHGPYCLEYIKIRKGKKKGWQTHIPQKNKTFFSLNFQSHLLNPDIWKLQKHNCGCCHFVSNSLYHWYEQGWTVWQKYQICHEWATVCSSLAKANLSGSNQKQKTTNKQIKILLSCTNTE